jgi:hypothetical protein
MRRSGATAAAVLTGSDPGCWRTDAGARARTSPVAAPDGAEATGLRPSSQEPRADLVGEVVAVVPRDTHDLGVAFECVREWMARDVDSG